MRGFGLYVRSVVRCRGFSLRAFSRERGQCGSVRPAFGNLCQHDLAQSEERRVRAEEREEQTDVGYVDQDDVERVYVPERTAERYEVGHPDGKRADLSERIVGRGHIESRSRVGVDSLADAQPHIRKEFGHERACDRRKNNHYAVVNKRDYAVLDFEFIVSERRRQNAQRE